MYHSSELIARSRAEYEQVRYGYRLSTTEQAVPVYFFFDFFFRYIIF